MASLVAAILVVALAGLLSSPDVPPVTIATWAKVAPADFVATAASELAGTSETAHLRPPLQQRDAAACRACCSRPPKIPGVRQPIDAAQTFVLAPLEKEAPTNPALAQALQRYNAAAAKVQLSWATAYANAVTKVHFDGRGRRRAPGRRRAGAGHCSPPS